MFSAIRRRVSYVNVAVTVALVFAMTGGAYAARHYVITSTKQISPSVLKKLVGKTGAKGATGPQGAAGTNGTNGTAGSNGTNGTNGASVTSSAETKGANCAEGGSKFTSASGVTYACNGKEGSPWTVGGKLPEGQSERGAWAVTGTATEVGETLSAPISFTIPLETGPSAHFINEAGEELFLNSKFEVEERTSTVCKGTDEEPTAEPGNLCAYAHQQFNSKLAQGFGFLNVEAGGIGAGKVGTVLSFEAEEAGKVVADGTWAVTAE